MFLEDLPASRCPAGVRRLSLAIVAEAAQADSIYDVTIDTSGLSGQDATLAFDFIAGGGAQNNSVDISKIYCHLSELPTGRVLGVLPPISLVNSVEESTVKCFSKTCLRRGVWLGAMISLAIVAEAAQADSIYDVTIDTSGLSGQDATLAFDFIAGGGAQNNSVDISKFTSDGVLGAAGPDSGTVSGSLPGGVTLTTANGTSFFNEICSTSRWRRPSRSKSMPLTFGWRRPGCAVVFHFGQHSRAVPDRYERSDRSGLTLLS